MDASLQNKLIRYVTEESSSVEVAEVERLLKENPEMLKEYEKIKKVWGLEFNEEESWDVDLAANRLRKDINNIDLKLFKSEDFNGIKTEEKRTIHTLHNRNNTWNWMVRFVAVLLMAGFFSLFVIIQFDLIDFQQSSKISYVDVITEKGQRDQLQLNDGTIVKLNVDSKLSHPATFDSENRIVYLSGEAYFDVANEARPFYVITDMAVVDVKGTTFNIYAYGDEDIRVVVERGVVSLKSILIDNGEAIELVGGDMGLVNRNNTDRIEVYRDIDVNQHMSWLNQRLVFDDEPLSQVIRQLERWYRIKITLSEPELAERRLTVTFENDPLPLVLRLITMSLELDMEHNNDGSILFSKANASQFEEIR